MWNGSAFVELVSWAADRAIVERFSWAAVRAMVERFSWAADRASVERFSWAAVRAIVRATRAHLTPRCARVCGPGGPHHVKGTT